MTVWFVSRHPGALEWMQNHGPAFDRHVTHLASQEVAVGDTVVGSLPVNLAAEICARGARYFNLSLRLREEDRGRELSAGELAAYDAVLEEFSIRKTL